MQNTREKLLDALELHKANRIDEAVVLYNAVIKEDPDNDMALSFLGIIALGKNEPDNALNYFLKAVSIKPESDYYKEIGNIYFDKKRYKDAIEAYEKAIALNPEFKEAFFNLGIAYYSLAEDLKAANDSEQAIFYYQKVLKINPNYADVYFKIGVIYQETGNFQKAVEYYTKTLELVPNSAKVYYNLGNIFLDENQPCKAAECFNKSLFIEPENTDTKNNYATALYNSGKIQESIDLYENLVKTNPDEHDIRLNLACAYLITNNYEKGWKYYESRFHISNKIRPVRKSFNKPEWDGSNLKGKTIFVYHEQGFGDTIHFSRYLHVLHSMGAGVIFKPQPQLETLFKINDLKSEIISDTTPEENIEFDFHIPLLSLPRLLNANLNNIPTNQKYLNADKEKINLYKEKYFKNTGFKVGIAWHATGLNNIRTAALKYFLKLAQLPNIKLYSLQKGLGAEQLKSSSYEITDLGATFQDFSDTAAAIENLDLVISVDTVIPHLSGAMEKPTWILLPFIPDYRWGMNLKIASLESTPWYHSCRLFRQKETDNWSEVMERVFESLKSKI